jgi:hypothetical protein
MQLGPFIGRHNLDHAVRGLSRVLGLRTCSGKLAPDEDFSPCIYGQMGHCAAPCNLSIASDAYNERVSRAVAFLRSRSGPLMGELARAREQAVAAMRFEEARRYHRELEALAAFTERVTRLSRVVTENNLVIVIMPQPAEAPAVQEDTDDSGAHHASSLADSSATASPVRTDSSDGSATSPTNQNAWPVAYVILSGRLALTLEIDSPDAANAVSAFVAENYDRYRLRAVARGELEAMTIVARWLRERDAADGRLIYLSGPRLEPAMIINAAGMCDSVAA